MMTWWIVGEPDIPDGGAIGTRLEPDRGSSVFGWESSFSLEVAHLLDTTSGPEQSGMSNSMSLTHRKNRILKHMTIEMTGHRVIHQHRVLTINSIYSCRRNNKTRRRSRAYKFRRMTESPRSRRDSINTLYTSSRNSRDFCRRHTQ